VLSARAGKTGAAALEPLAGSVQEAPKGEG